MNANTLTPHQLNDFLLNVAPQRPVFIWGAPGIGKSALVEQFAQSVGIPCVSLLGSQLAPEDLIGVPQIKDGKSVFCPPRNIAREEPYCLFLDELNACSQEVQKAFYSLIHDKKLGEYHLPVGSIVIGAGNRAQDNAIVRPMSSALINRMVHVHLRTSHREWLEWAYSQEVHPWVLEYIQNRPDHLWSAPPKTEEPFSTPRSWHMLSDGLKAYGPALNEALAAVLAHGCLSGAHAKQFMGFVKQLGGKFKLSAILKGELRWPSEPSDRDILYFLALSFRAYMLKEFPKEKSSLKAEQKQAAAKAKALLVELSGISLEIAQMVVSTGDDGDQLPAWFMVEIVRDLPRLVKHGKE